MKALERKPIRLLIGTSDRHTLEVFFYTVVAPNISHMESAVNLWNISLREAVAWHSRCGCRKHWSWVTRSKCTKVQTWYSRQDKLLESLQDPTWRAYFEDAYSLYSDFGTLFVTTLQHPEASVLLTARSSRKLAEANGDTAMLEEYSSGFFEMLTQPKKLERWWARTDRSEP